MRIRTKIYLGFLIIAFLLLIGAAITVHQFLGLSKVNRSILEENHNAAVAMNTMHNALELYDYSVLALFTDSTENSSELMHKADSLYLIFKKVSFYVFVSEDEKKQLAQFHEKFEIFRHEWVSSIMGKPNISMYLSSKENQFKKLRKNLNQLMITFQKKLLKDTDNLYEQSKRAMTPGLITIITALILIILFIFIINKYYLRPLIRLKEGVEKFKYKHTFQVEIETQDEISELAKSIDELTKTFKK